MKNALIIHKMYKIAAMFFILAAAGGNLFAQEQLEEVVSVPTVEYKAEASRDLFREYKKEKETTEAAQEASVKPLPALTVQGIVWGGSMPQAIINNQVLKEGDVIGEIKITKINKNEIEVFYTGRLYVISSPASKAISSISLLDKTGQ